MSILSSLPHLHKLHKLQICLYMSNIRIFYLLFKIIFDYFRNNAMGLTSMAARLGGIVSPMIIPLVSISALYDFNSSSFLFPITSQTKCYVTECLEKNSAEIKRMNLVCSIMSLS